MDYDYFDPQSDMRPLKLFTSTKAQAIVNTTVQSDSSLVILIIGWGIFRLNPDLLISCYLSQYELFYLLVTV